jgi:hypothetical protein
MHEPVYASNFASRTRVFCINDGSPNTLKVNEMAKKQVSAKKTLKPKPARTKTTKKSSSSMVTPKKTANKGPAAAKKAPPSKKSPVKSPSAAPRKAGVPKTVPAKQIGPAKSRPGMRTMATAKDLAVASKGIDVGGRVTEIVQDWANAPSEPASDAVLSTLWANSGIDSPFTVGAQDLTTRLNKDLGSKLRPSDVTTTTSLSDLIQMIV